jgi:5-methylcytosine-specific restriction endonuclease McrA
MDREKKREADRQRQRRIYDDFITRRETLIKKFGHRCQHCGVTVEREDSQFHHTEYHPTESAYPKTCKTMSIRLKRLAEVESHPERFKLLCVDCHNKEHDRF